MGSCPRSRCWGASTAKPSPHLSGPCRRRGGDPGRGGGLLQMEVTSEQAQGRPGRAGSLADGAERLPSWFYFESPGSCWRQLRSRQGRVLSPASIWGEWPGGRRSREGDGLRQWTDAHLGRAALQRSPRPGVETGRWCRDMDNRQRCSQSPVPSWTPWAGRLSPGPSSRGGRW